MSTKNYFFKSVWLLLLATGLYACFPSNSEDISDFDMAATTHDESVNFQQFKTFYLPDTVLHLKDTINLGTNVDISREYDELILGQIRDNMLANGYTEVSSTNDPNLDLVLLVSITATQNTGIVDYYPWYGVWGWAFPELGPTFNWFYPWGGVTEVYNFTTGTVLFTLIDYEKIGDNGNDIPAVWIGGVNGIFENSSTMSTEDRLTRGIDQCFRQSSYLKLN